MRFAWRSYERRLSRRNRPATAPPDDVYGIPPPRLLVLVSGAADANRYLETGREEADAISGLLMRHGRTVNELTSILDLGCGCGRIARHLPRIAKNARVCGCDLNGELVGWCTENLPFMDARVNPLRPPTPFSEQFDFIYAISVFTHLSESLQHEWMGECRRLLKPGGLLLFTTQGDRFRDSLNEAQRLAYDSGRIVVRFEELEGANLCSTYHPPEFLATMLEGFEPIETIKTGLPGVGSGGPLHLQDVHLVTRSE